MYVGNHIERRIDAIEQELFIAYGKVVKINPPSQASLAKTAVACSLTPYIAPFTVSEEDKRIKTNICGIVSRPIDLTSARMLTVSAAELESKLKLEPPKKVVEYAVKTDPDQGGKPVAKTVKRKREPREEPIQSFPSSSLASIMPRSSFSSQIIAPIAAATSSHRASAPVNAINLYEVINPVFHQFWSLEFDDMQVTPAFFANIDVFNAKEFGLPTYASEACSLPVIQKKISERRYFTSQAFVYDMETMFGNVLKYYPESHPAFSTALHLQAKFATLWIAAEPQLRYG